LVRKRILKVQDKVTNNKRPKVGETHFRFILQILPREGIFHTRVLDAHLTNEPKKKEKVNSDQFLVE
jgi:hypothetical protein